MLAKRVTKLPVEGAWIFEPKWDGFRTLIFRDGDVLDGEIVVAKNQGLDFDALQLSIRSHEIPASVVFFDLLCENEDLDNEHHDPLRLLRPRFGNPAVPIQLGFQHDQQHQKEHHETAQHRDHHNNPHAPRLRQVTQQRRRQQPARESE